jgi:UDP-2-acetamido-3-amino-2,3-dideoxy-glucuronate N-acetyltransferase
LNIGKLRTEENILWSFAPHDISVILNLVEKEPKHVRVFGEAYLQDGLYDTTITDLTFDDRLKAHIYVSWLHPFKEQKLVVIGNSGMAVFNDMEATEKLTLYHHKIEWIKRAPVATKAQKEIIPIETNEPLREACLHFLNCIEKRITPKTDAHEALSVLKVLQKAQEYLDKENEHEQ